LNPIFLSNNDNQNLVLFLKEILKIINIPNSQLEAIFSTKISAEFDGAAPSATMLLGGCHANFTNILQAAYSA